MILRLSKMLYALCLKYLSSFEHVRFYSTFSYLLSNAFKFYVRTQWILSLARSLNLRWIYVRAHLRHRVLFLTSYAGRNKMKRVLRTYTFAYARTYGPVPSKSHGTSRNEVSPPSTTRTVSSLCISLPFHWRERPRPEATKSRQIALLTIKYSTFRGWNSYAITEAAPLAQLRRPTCSWKLIACHKTQRCVNLPSSATSMNNF